LIASDFSRTSVLVFFCCIALFQVTEGPTHAMDYPSLFDNSV